MKALVHASTRRHRLSLAVCAALAACAPLPVLPPTSAVTPASWQSRLPTDPPAGALVDWWRQFDDPAVADLVAAALDTHTSLAEAAARIAEARALAGEAAADQGPALNGQLRAERAAVAVAPGQTARSANRSASFDASWEIDLWGGKRQAHTARWARVQAREADWQAVRVSLIGEVARHVVNHRACTAVAELLAQDLRSHEVTARLTAQKMSAGMAAPADVALLEASTAESRQRQVAQKAQCDLLVKALVALTQRDEAALRQRLLPVRPLPMPAALRVEQVPARAVSQRPDVAAAERELQATRADIQVAWADQFPKLSLLGSIGTASTRLGSATGTASTWSFGPVVDIPLFDGGRRRLGVDAARARHDGQLAAYQGLVRDAVRETEEALVRLDAAANRDADASLAAAQYERHWQARTALFQAGGASAFELEEARRRQLSAQQALVEVRQERVLAWIALYKALGGGWTADPTQPPERVGAARPQPPSHRS